MTGAIATGTNVAAISDLRKRIEAARKYDNQTSERRNYWGELAIWSERRIGELLVESKADGTIKHGGDKQSASVAPCTLVDLLGTETDNEARHISSRVAKPPTTNENTSEIRFNPPTSLPKYA